MNGNRRSSPYTRDYDYDANYEDQDYEYDYWGTHYGDWGYGPYTVVGPRNYRRSDERILDDVNDHLTWQGQIDASEIEVSVDDGVVTLRGTLDNRRERRIAEEVAENVMSVWDVNNEIKIRVDRPMARDVYVPFHAANIEGGRIRLHVHSGEVDNQGWEMPEILESS